MAGRDAYRYVAVNLLSQWIAGVLRTPPVEASADLSPPRVGRASALDTFTFPLGAVGKSTVLAIPTLQRAHDLLVSLVSGLPISPYRVTFDPTGDIEQATPPLPWHFRPDPTKTRHFFLGCLASDLWSYGRAYCRVTSRYRADNFPASFSWMPYERVSVTYAEHSPPEAGLVPGCRVHYGGSEVPYADVVEFLSPITGVCSVAWRAIQTATSLEEAALRFATSEVPAGWLKQTGGEPLDATELAAIAQSFSDARKTNTTAALNEFMDYVESSFDPSKMQLVEARSFQALELARVGNVPPYLVGAPAGTGMTYMNAQQARVDAVDFGAAPIIATIDQTFSGPAISPAGNFVRLNVNAWLSNPFLSNTPVPTEVAQPGGPVT